MNFYNTTDTEDSLVHETWDLCDADITSYPLAKVTRRFNHALETLVGKIVAADGTWQYDDTNFTDSPRGTATLIEGQEAYSFASEYLEVEQIDVLDTGGVYRRILPFDPDDLSDGMSPEEYFGSTTTTTKKGFPEYYDIQGDTIRLYPAPTSTAVTLAAGLRILFKRTADLFTVSDTTQEPGLPSPYHVLLAFYAAIPFCVSYKKDRVEWLEKKWDEGTKDLIKFFGHRERDRRKIMSNKRVNFR